MNVPLVYLNGRLLPFAEAALPLHDAGFVSGATVVDNARTFRHKLFRWPDHLARFRRDCAACYIPLTATDEQLTATAAELVSHNAKLLPPGGELQLVTFATPGPLGFYVGESTSGPATLGMVTYPLPVGRLRRFFTDGVTLAFAGVQSAGAQDLLPPRVKHRSRMMWHVAERRLNDPASPFHHPGAVPVVFTSTGAGDTAIGSILSVIDGAVVRPVPGGVLDSISVTVVGELCTAAGIPFTDTPLNMMYLCSHRQPPEPSAAVTRVTELMLTGTGFCLAGVKAFASPGAIRQYDWPGPVFRQLLAAWSDLVGMDIAQSFTHVAK